MLRRAPLAPAIRILRRHQLHGSFGRGLCDAAKPLAGRMADMIAKVKGLELKLDVLEKDVLVDTILGLVKNQEITVEQVTGRLPEFVIDTALPDLPVTTASELRFEIGRTVECRLGPETWARGKVVGHMYREDDWPEGQKAPYQVLLEGDDLTS